MWTSASTGAICRCMGIGISHSPREKAVTASRMRAMISRYARTLRIWWSSRIRIKERLADGGAGGEMWFTAETQRAQRKRREDIRESGEAREGGWDHAGQLSLVGASECKYASGSGGEAHEEAGSAEHAAGRGNCVIRWRCSLAGAAETGGRGAAGYGDERDAAGHRAVQRRVAGSQPGVRSGGVAGAAEEAGGILRGPVPAAGRDEFRRIQPGWKSGLPAAAQPAGA